MSEQTNMAARYEHEIPEGYEARIEGNKVIIELKESKDERIRKEMIYFFTEEIPQCSIKEHADKIRVFISWLEKQKMLSELGKYIAAERAKPGFIFAGNDSVSSVSWEELPLGVRKHDYPYYFIGDLDCFPFNVEKQKEQKDYRKLYEDIAKSEWFKKAYEGKSLGCDDEQKEQRSKDVKNVDNLHQYLYGEQKPTEWSEQDKHNLNSVINLVHSTSDGAWGSCVGDRIGNWLKSLPERFNLQPKR